MDEVRGFPAVVQHDACPRESVPSRFQSFKEIFRPGVLILMHPPE